MRYRFALILLLALVTAAGALVGSGWLRNQMMESVSREPTPFTELYFTNHVQLPKHFLASRANHFSFTIANHERHATSYSYVVTARSRYGTAELASGTVSVDSGRAAAELVQFKPTKLHATYVITVHLGGRPETIHFRRSSSA